MCVYREIVIPSSRIPVDCRLRRMGTNCGVLAVTLLRQRASWVQTAIDHVSAVGSGVLIVLWIRTIWAINVLGTL